MRPHWYCLPILKREEHRRALVAAATSGSAAFFLGTDSAPHAAHAEGARQRLRRLLHGAARPRALRRRPSTPPARLDRLEGFASFHGADFYGLPRNAGTVTLQRRDWTVPEMLPFGEAELKPLAGGETLAWRLVARHRERHMSRRPHAVPDRRRQRRRRGDREGAGAEAGAPRRDPRQALLLLGRLRGQEPRLPEAALDPRHGQRDGGQELHRHRPGHRRRAAVRARGCRRSSSSSAPIPTSRRW